MLLAAANKEYLPAAQKLRDYFGRGKAPLYDYVVKIDEIYCPVIQVSGAAPAKR